MLDRLESVDGGKFQSTMNELARLVAENAAFQVKIAVVVEGRLADGRWEKAMLPQNFDPDRVYEFIMDQKELSLSESPPLLWED